MSNEAWELVKKIEVGGVDLELALQCAPLIAGLKVSNLLNINIKELKRLDELLTGSSILWHILYADEFKANVLLYNPKLLEDYLTKEEVAYEFSKMGYEDFFGYKIESDEGENVYSFKNETLKNLLERFSKKYAIYMKEKNIFPHELGFLLGYPVEDIKGFINHKGEKYQYVGYWKVYADYEKKKKIFESFENAKESLINLLYHGVSMAEIISICCSKNRKIQINY
ncbi:MAG: DUF3793 family protein [Lachnospiraceae bacterium]|nr:DUF3793 family protein [Lachnospiraceae bacterium]MBQ9232530.1 DUF3793 family protein [Lachnospiraceae bacterium]